MIIFAHRSTMRTARKLAGVLGVEVSRPKDTDDIVIRWGSRGMPEARYEINPLPHLDKADQRERLAGHGISVPRAWDPVRYPFMYPVLGRPRRHSRGRDFYLCKSMKDVERAMMNGCEYFSEWINKTGELRVHCAHGKILCIQDKVLDGDKGTFSGKPWVTVDRKDWNLDLCQQCLMSLEVLGKDFGAVDVMKFTGGFAICEVNLAPALGGRYVFEKYVQYLSWIKRFAPQPHWGWRKFRKAESLAWKNPQFNKGLANSEDAE